MDWIPRRDQGNQPLCRFPATSLAVLPYLVTLVRPAKSVSFLVLGESLSLESHTNIRHKHLELLRYFDTDLDYVRPPYLLDSLLLG